VVPPAQKFTPVIYIENRLWFDIKDHLSYLKDLKQLKESEKSEKSEKSKNQLTQQQNENTENATAFSPYYIERVEPALNQESLVKIIIDKITKIEHQYHSEIDTIQIDSDWNESTESLYFEFLRALKKQSHKKISVTIRLSQITYAKSMKQFARKGKRTAEEINSIYNVGVPPADKGMLMYYNMNNAFYTSTKNYVIDNVEGAKYMINFDKYPLKLDIGLPIYYQVSIIRFGEVIGFMQGISWKDVQNKDFNKIDESHVKVLKTQYFSGHLIYEGDILRMDGVTMNELKIATKLLKKALPTPEHIVFYEWSYRDQYDENQLKNLW
jgi:hypothetical protein